MKYEEVYLKAYETITDARDSLGQYFAFYNASVIDCGIPVIGMHSPYELISKADLYYSYRGYSVFLEQC